MLILDLNKRSEAEDDPPAMASREALSGCAGVMLGIAIGSAFWVIAIVMLVTTYYQQK
jgi:hypothetical protein